MATTAEVLIIGAGIVGSSTAYHLAEKGVKNIIVVEKDNVASGATGRSSAMLTPGTRRVPGRESLEWQSVQVYQKFQNELGVDCGFRQTGDLGLFGTDPEELESATETVKAAQAIGIRAEIISTEDAKTLQPFLRVDDLGGAIYNQDAGNGDGYSAANAFMGEARKLGVQLMRYAQVASLEVEGGRVKGVRTITGDSIGAPIVVMATGAWSMPLAKTAGIDIPLTPRRIVCGILQRPPEIANHMAYHDRTIGTYWRMEGADLTVLGIRNREIMPECDPDNYPQTIPEETRSMWARRLIHRIPAMEKAGWRLIWTAPDSYLPDHTPMLGPAPGVDGLYFAFGCSGVGMTMGPIYGKLLAQVIADGQAQSGDIHYMRPSRFAEGKPNHIPTEDEWPYPTKVDRQFP